MLRLVGLVGVVSYSSVNGRLWHAPCWIAAGVLISWIGWAGWTVVPARSLWMARIFLCAMAVGGGLTAARVTGSAITAMATVFSALALVTEPVVVGLGIAALTVVCACLSILTVTRSPSNDLLSLLVGVAVWGLMGWSRRQARTSAEQNRVLVEQNRVIRVERDRAAALAERGRLARDIHDVLAHTLGGLVRQLDAADALLEAGDLPRAAERVRASHTLAVSGLEDARRVVGALRAEGFDLGGELNRLAADERAAGGQVELRIDADLRGLDEQAAVAIARAAQEALTNARKHAPGQPIMLMIRDEDGRLELEAADPVAGYRGSLSGSGAGAGLLGMTERIAAVGGTVDARKEDGRWRVRIRVPRR